MAIIKRAKNIVINCNGKDTIMAKTYQETAEKILIKSTLSELVLNSVKKINSTTKD